MKGRIYYLQILMGLGWMLSGSISLAKEPNHLLLVAAAHNDSQKSAAAFEHVHALGIDAEGRTLFLGAHTGLFRRENGGRSWQKVALPARASHPDVMAITPDPKNSKTIYIGAHEAGVLKSADGGATWKEINSGLGGVDVHGIAIDPNDGKLHALVRDKGEGIYRSTNGGGKWIRVDDGPGGEVKGLYSVNISTGMGGIFLYAPTAEGLKRNPDCF